MKRSTRLAALILLALPLSASIPARAGVFGDNKTDDIFTVKSLDGKQAVLEGVSKDLKEGDTLFFARSPFHFTVTSVKGTRVTIALPEKHDLALGNTLMRKENDQVKNAADTEKRLKQALEE